MEHYYFIGIGGIGMSGLAKILIQRGAKVSGSDPSRNNQTEDLSVLGANISYEQNGTHVPEDADFVVTTSAVNENNQDYQKAKELGLNFISRSELLNKVITTQKALAVTGTHGKTTTSSMLAHVLEDCKMDATAIIGAEVKSISGNAKNGEGEYSVAEVCEYKRAFLDIHPFAAIITNIEEDHLDCYKDIDDIVGAFIAFAGQIDKDGFLVYCSDDLNAIKVANSYEGRKIAYGLKDSGFTARNITVNNHKQEFDIFLYDKKMGTARLIIPGRHNILNALSVFATAIEIGLRPDQITNSLETFNGAERRFQIKGELNGTIVVDDYAHHPTEIIATLKGAKEFYAGKKIVVVFQPHQHSRTRFLKDEFTNALTLADVVIMPEIYAVRDTEADIKSISSKDIVDTLNKRGVKAFYSTDFTGALKMINDTITDNDILITIGAGPVYQIGESFLSQGN